MMLGFMYLLKDVFAGGCRVYVFVNSLYDVTEIMETDSIDKAVQSVLQAVPAKGVYSDYNRPLEMLWKKNRKYLLSCFLAITVTIRTHQEQNG